MKQKIAIVILVFLSLSISAQKFAYVDTEYILNNIPSYKSAQEQLDKFSDTWQTEVEGFYAQVDKMYKDYQTEKVLLSEEMKKKREEEITLKEKEVKELQKKYFGPEGLLFKKREELVKPIQEEVYKAIKELSLDAAYAIIFDTSAGATVLFSDPKYDKSDLILQKMGYKN